jgi:hypothetical protein
MKNFIVESGDFITTSGIYRMDEHPGRESTLIYGDAVPTFQGRKIKFRLIRAAKTPGEAKDGAADQVRIGRRSGVCGGRELVRESSPSITLPEGEATLKTLSRSVGFRRGLLSAK